MLPKEKIYREKEQKVIENLKKRNMNGIYCENSAQGVAEIVKMIPQNSLVGLGGSESIMESGLIEELRKLDIRLLDRYKEGLSKEEINKMRREALLSDVFITSSNAVTVDGKLVNIDGTGNRVAAVIYGPSKVIFLVGMNKVVRTLEEAISRIKNHAAPLNAVRVGVETPCYHLGCCNEPHCFPPNRICSQVVIIETNSTPGRIMVVLVGDELGF
ncbi:MAG: lactate utilization protein [Candidatus Aminicenantes bacterium]|nr:lactate utilization protein [Candidatus Aminicenantes bacterium]